MKKDNSPLRPDTQLLVKLGSIVVHMDEAISNTAHEFDVIAIRTLLQDEDVESWLNEMRKMALLPEKRQRLL